MTDNRLRISAGPPIAAALEATGGDFPTGRLNAIVERYLAMVEASRPALSRAEWLAICDAMSDTAVVEGVRVMGEGPHIPAWRTLALNVADAGRLNGLGDKWGIDAPALAQRLHAMPEPEQIAIIETVERFWSLAQLTASEALDLATSHPAGWPETEQGQ